MQVLCFSTLSEGLQPARPPEFPVPALGVRVWCDQPPVLVGVRVGAVARPQVCSKSQGATLEKFLAAFFCNVRNTA